MSYGHAGKLAEIVAAAQAAAAAKPAPAIDPALYRRDDVRRILVQHRISPSGDHAALRSLAS